MWPTPQDYNEAVQTPRLAFDDEELRNSLPELNALGLPKPVSGSFASVYQMRASNGKQWAVRCFLRNVPNQEERYAAISDHLARHRLACMVPFEFVRKGIRVNGQWFPILKMQWVDGIPLIEWIQRNVDNAEKIESLQKMLSEMCVMTASAGIAHGDLQHGNIFVSRDERGLLLVDYDGLFVPALKAMGSAELGHRHYQHPGRNGSHFGPYLDNFSAWSIWESLQVIAQDPRLWRRLGGGEECLIFRQEDYAAPHESVAFSLLEHHDSAIVREASQTMRRLLKLRLEEVPPLGEPLPQRGGHLDPMPPLTVPGVKLNSPTDGGKNARVMVAEAKAPTLVVEKPRVKLKVAPNAPPSANTPGVSAWTVPPSTVPPTTPPPPLQPPPASPKIQQILTLGVVVFAILISTFLNTMQEHKSVTDPRPKQSAVAPKDVKIITNIARLVSADSDPQNGAVLQYQAAYAEYQKGHYDEAYQRFTNLQQVHWVERVDEALCKYMMAKSLAASNLAKKDPTMLDTALKDMVASEITIHYFGYWVAQQSLDIANLQLQMKRPLDAANTLSADLAYCQDPNWRYNKAVLLRTAALDALNSDQQPALALPLYSEFVLLITTDPVVHSLFFAEPGSSVEAALNALDEVPKVFKAQRSAAPSSLGEEGLYVFNDMSTEARHLASKEQYDVAIRLCLNGAEMFKNNKVLSKDLKAASYIQNFSNMVSQLEIERAQHAKKQ